MFSISKELFCVLQLLETPNRINSTVCVPYTWVKKKSGSTYVTYPLEEAIQTEIRVRKREPPSKEWGTYAAFPLFVTESYDNAEHFIAKRSTCQSDKKGKYTKTKIKETKKLGTCMKALNTSKEAKLSSKFTQLSDKDNNTKCQTTDEVLTKIKQLFGEEDEPEKLDKSAQTDIKLCANKATSTSELSQISLSHSKTQSQQTNNEGTNRTRDQNAMPGAHTNDSSNSRPNPKYYYKPPILRSIEGLNIYINGVDVKAYPQISIKILPTRIDSCCHNHTEPSKNPRHYREDTRFHHNSSQPLLSSDQMTQLMNQRAWERNQCNEQSRMHMYPRYDHRLPEQVQSNMANTSQTQIESRSFTRAREQNNGRNNSHTQTQFHPNPYQVKQYIGSNGGNKVHMHTQADSTQTGGEYMHINGKNNAYAQTEAYTNQCKNQTHSNNKWRCMGTKTHNKQRSEKPINNNNTNSSHQPEQFNSNQVQTKSNPNQTAEPEIQNSANTLTKEQFNGRNSSCTQTKYPNQITDTRMNQMNRETKEQASNSTQKSRVYMERNKNNSYTQTEFHSSHRAENKIHENSERGRMETTPHSKQRPEKQIDMNIINSQLQMQPDTNSFRNQIQKNESNRSLQTEPYSNREEVEIPSNICKKSHATRTPEPHANLCKLTAEQIQNGKNFSHTQTQSASSQWSSEQGKKRKSLYDEQIQSGKRAQVDVECHPNSNAGQQIQTDKRNSSYMQPNSNNQATTNGQSERNTSFTNPKMADPAQSSDFVQAQLNENQNTAEQLQINSKNVQIQSVLHFNQRSENKDQRNDANGYIKRINNNERNEPLQTQSHPNQKETQPIVDSSHIQTQFNEDQREIQSNAENIIYIQDDNEEYFSHEEMLPVSSQISGDKLRTMGERLFNQIQLQLRAYKNAD